MQHLVPCASVTQSIELREYSDVTLRVETPHYEEGANVVVEVVDQGIALLACTKRESITVHDGSVTLLLPVEGSGTGALQVRFVVDGSASCYLIPAAVTATGDLAATLRIST